MSETSYVSETDAIMKALGYMKGARSGKGADMKSSFHPDATIFGYVGTDLFGGPIQMLYDWNDQNGAARTFSSGSVRWTSQEAAPACGSISTTGPVTASPTILTW